jgi:hypothetical protein
MAPPSRLGMTGCDGLTRHSPIDAPRARVTGITGANVICVTGGSRPIRTLLALDLGSTLGWAARLPDGRRRADAPQRGGTSALISTQPNRIT